MITHSPVTHFVLLMLGFLNLFAGNGLAQEQRDEVRGGIRTVSKSLCEDMRRHHVLNRGILSCDRLRLVTFSYLNFNGEAKNDGAIVVLDALAQEVLQLFTDLRLAKFPIEKARLMNAYDGNDDASMEDNNTSSFNDRSIAGSHTVSMHAYGAAIDINPRINPFVIPGGKNKTVKPPSGAKYLDRSARAPGMSEAVVQIFANHGFLIWGGDWTRPIDFQHFQIGRDLAERLIALSGDQAREYFNNYAMSYRKCTGEIPNRRSPAASKCRGEPRK